MIYRAHTVLLHVNHYQCRRIRCESGVVRPVIWLCRNLTLSHFVMGYLSGLLDNRAVVMGRIQNSQCPDTRSTSCHQHEWTVHQTRRAPPLSRFLRQTVPGTIVPTSIAPQPYLGGPSGLLLGGGTRGFDDNIVPIGFSMTLHGGQQRRSSEVTGV